MPANLTAPRPDIVFLRRRLKRGESAPVVATTSAPASTSLKLSRTPSVNGEASTSSPSFFTAEPTAVSIPLASGMTYLKENNSAVRMNKRQSAIGSLVISGAMVAGWQLLDGSSGYIYNQGVAPTEGQEYTPIAFKKRSIVEFHKELLIVGLKNVQHLKRIIIVPKQDSTLKAETLGETSVVMDFEPFTALYVSVIDSMLEFRKEDFRNTLTETFNLQTVKLPNARIALR